MKKHSNINPGSNQKKKISSWILTLYPVLIFIFISIGCNNSYTKEQMENNVPSPVYMTSSPEIMPGPVLTISPESDPEETSIQHSLAANQRLQGADFGYVNDLDFNEIAIGMYDKNYPYCGYPILPDNFEKSEEILLELHYKNPVIPQQISMYGNINPSQIERIELLNSISGIGLLLNQENSMIQQIIVPEGACSTRLDISIQTDIEVDTILLEGNQGSTNFQIAAIEMMGSLKNYWDTPVFWRVPLPGTPIDIAMGQNGQVYVAVEPNRLFAYDVEGNQLREYPVPEHSEIAALASDPFGNLLIQDNGFNWFIMLSPEGDQLSTGVVPDFYWVDVSPINGNLYLMNNDEISIYTTDTGDLINQFTFDEMAEYSALTFSPQGDLFVLDDAQWEPKIVQLNSDSFEDMDANPLRICNQMELTAKDLAIDANGNQYVLFTVNCAQIAIHEYDATGSLIKCFGSLDVDLNEWSEGTFLDPHAITINPDGRFLLIADGYDEKSYLTAYLMEIE